MHRVQIRRPRANTQTAAEFARTGEWKTGPENYLTGQQRKEEIDDVERELQGLTRQNFPRTNNLEFAVLKAHLIVEYAITQYIRCFSHVVIEPKDLKFSFSQKVQAAYLLGLGAYDPLTLPVIDALNKCRNQVAHSFVLDRNAVDALLRMNIESPQNFKPVSDRERIKVLRALTDWLSTNIAANIAGSFWLATREA